IGSDPEILPYGSRGYGPTAVPARLVGVGADRDRPAGQGFRRSRMAGPAAAVGWPGRKPRGGGGSGMATQVVHFEIPADDMERAQTFYREAFGWRLSPMPEMSYTLATTVEPDERGMPAEPGAINGGMTPRAEPVTHPVIVVNVDDIDQSLQRIQELGGRVVEGRTAVGDMGYSAYFADPDGNVIGLWESAGDGQAG